MKRDSLAHSYVREVAPRWEPEPPARYSLTWQVIRDVLLAGIVGTALVYAFLLVLTAAS